MSTGDIIAIKTHVITCYSCGAWLGRVPTLWSEGDKGDFCTKCGCTSVRVRDGRPFGPRSKDWEWIHAEVLKLIETFQDGLDGEWMLAEIEREIVRRKPTQDHP